MNRWLVWIPLAVFSAFLGLAAYQLTQPKDDFVKSAMLGKPLPLIELASAKEGEPPITTADFRDGTPKLLNIWASWCVPCKAEAPHLETLKEAGVPIIGVAIRDQPEDMAAFLAEIGNPYVRLATDPLSEISITVGASGVPETFVIDGEGVITHQHIGDIRADDIPELLEALEDAR